MASVMLAAAPVTSSGTLTLEVEGLDSEALVSALRLRLPALRVQLAAPGDAPPRAGDVRVRVSRARDGSLELSASLADGRVVRRGLAVDEQAPVRAVATSIAHWLVAIDAGRAAPREVVPEAPVVAAPEPVAVVSREPEPAAVVSRGPAAAASRGPGPASAVVPTRVVRARPGPSPPALELGPVVGFVPLFGVGRPEALGGSLGVGIAAGLELRTPRGAVVGGELRVLDVRAGEHRLTRLRGALLGGYALARGRFTLRALAGVTVERWWSGAVGSLYGGTLRLVPGLRGRLGPRLHVHAGVRLELAVSGTSGAAAVRLVDGSAALFRAGGVELGAGLELGLAWDLRTRRGP